MGRGSFTPARGGIMYGRRTPGRPEQTQRELVRQLAHAITTNDPVRLKSTATPMLQTLGPMRVLELASDLRLTVPDDETLHRVLIDLNRTAIDVYLGSTDRPPVQINSLLERARRFLVSELGVSDKAAGNMVISVKDYVRSVSVIFGHGGNSGQASPSSRFASPEEYEEQIGWSAEQALLTEIPRAIDYCLIDVAERLDFPPYLLSASKRSRIAEAVANDEENQLTAASCADLLIETGQPG
jgi:hypothetical protein